MFGDLIQELFQTSILQAQSFHLLLRLRKLNTRTHRTSCSIVVQHWLYNNVGIIHTSSLVNIIT